MQTHEEHQSRHTVERILMVSPDQNELLRRNRSRIFVWPANSSIVDMILFQNQRRIESFIPAVERAMKMAGVEISGISQSEEFSLTAAELNQATGLMNQFLSPTGWITIDDTVFDMIIEINIIGEHLAEPDEIMSVNALPIDGNIMENPLIFMMGVSTISNEIEQSAADSDNVTPIPQPATTVQPERELMAARKEQDRDDKDDNGRIAGKPGRVKNPALDMRLKANRDARMPQGDQERARSTTSSRA